MKRLLTLLLLLMFSLTLTANRTLQKADALFRNNDFKGAAIEYGKLAKQAEASKKVPAFDLFHVYNRLGESFLHLKEFALSELYYTRAFALPGDKGRNFLFNYGEALLANDQTERALQMFQQSLALSPNDPIIQDRIQRTQQNITLRGDSRALTHPVTVENRLNAHNNQHSLAWFRNALLFSSDRTSPKGSKKVGPLRLFHTEPLHTGGFGPVKELKIRTSNNVQTLFHSAAFDNGSSTLYAMRCVNTSRERNCNIMSYQVDSRGRVGRQAMPQSFHEPNATIGNPTLSSDGRVMFYTRTRDRRSDIFVVKRTGNNVWTEPKLLSSVINTNRNEAYPQLFQDSILFFASDGHIGMGGMDIFYTVISKNGVPHAVSGDSDLDQLVFSTPVNLGAPINSGADDFALLMRPDGNGGFFVSNRTADRRNKNKIVRFDRRPYALSSPSEHLLAHQTEAVATPEPTVVAQPATPTPVTPVATEPTVSAAEQARLQELQRREAELLQAQRELEAARALLANQAATQQAAQPTTPPVTEPVQQPAQQQAAQQPAQQPAATTPAARPQLPVVSPNDPGIRYRVQLMATKTPIEDYIAVFGELLQAIPGLRLEVLNNVDVRFPGYFHYVTSAFITHEEAVAVRDRIRRFTENPAVHERVIELGIQNSFIATFEGGRRVSIQMR